MSYDWNGMTGPLNKRLHFLDGLRGWGALVVVLAHVFAEAFPINDHVTHSLSRLGILNAGLAVWIFFLVSGFSLAVGFCRSRDNSTLVKVALGRYVRLAIPVFCAAAFLYLMFALGLVLPAQDRQPVFQQFLPLAPTLREVIGFALFNTFFAYSHATTLIGPLWTMPFELWGSCLVLGILFVVGRLDRRFYVYVLAGVLAFLINPIFTAFIVGMVMAEAYCSGAWARNAGRLSAAAFFLYMPALYGATLLPFAGDHPEWAYLTVATLLTTSCIFNRQLAAFLSSGLSRYLGKISFPLYLIHGPLMLAFGNAAYRWSGELTDLQKALVNLSIVFVCIACATLLAPIDRWGISAAKWFSGYVMSQNSVARHSEKHAAE